MKSIICVAIFFLVMCLKAEAQPGSLDNSFGTAGKIFDETFNGDCQAIAVQEDGKIVTGGRSTNNDPEKAGFLVARFNADGSLDESFGDKGKVIISSAEGSKGVSATALAIQPDGKILACGRFVTPYGDIAVVRYNADGSLDNSFSENGIVITSIGIEDIVGDMLLQPDGKIVVTGDRENGGYTGFVSFLLRYRPDGTLDKNFGDKGIVLTDFPTRIDNSAIALQPDGKILTGGTYGFAVHQYLIVRYNIDGAVDETFGSEGLAKLPLTDADNNGAQLNDIAIQANGDILATGYLGNMIALARFDSTGAVDSSFGDKSGYSVLPMETGYAIAKTVHVAADNKIIVTGLYVSYSPDDGHAAVKFNENGSIDSAFGENGVAVTGFGNWDLNPYTYSGALQRDGKILVGGAVWPDYDDDFTRITLVRFNNTEAVWPITYNSFTAVQNKQYITLNWQTAGEINNAHFVIQRSSNAVNYAEIAQVKSAGAAAATHNYSYTDKIPAEGMNYYRLKQVDKNGKYSYSNVVSAGFIRPGTIKLYPNPAKAMVTIEGLNAANVSTIFLMDVQGRLLQKISVKAAKHQLITGGLAKGTYIVKVVDDNGTTTQKFVKD